ncbi:adenine deaminase [Anaeramoeba flamelloides]|uniref:Adenine deaminase n=1 Tax=Anaeramoeba flamelloides TaxID=1746091 RepID=A0AAV7YV87_9EUKA|nr:adenine deaminase [Anaeramoeba flamelloides]
MTTKIQGIIFDPIASTKFPGEITIDESVGKIVSIVKNEDLATENLPLILPGLIDSHVHIESSMLIPSEFARIAVTHGTVATVSDPHEIANVNGIDGVRFMINNGKKVPFKFYFGVPSCVPATSFETSGSKIGLEEVETLFKEDKLLYLSEMMNFPGVIFDDENVHSLMNIAKKYNKPIDGHCPGLSDYKKLKKYVDSGITTDHECFTIEEAKQKIELGMKVLIREGSAAKNYETLEGLISTNPNDVMLCSDDLHPDSLVTGHINLLIKRSLKKGHGIFDILKCSCVNPVKHYKLDVGLLQKGDSADFILVNNLQDFKILETWIGGKKLFDGEKSFIESVTEKPINKFFAVPRTIEEFEITIPENCKSVKVIEVIDGELITRALKIPIEKIKKKDNKILPDPENDILKFAVVNRYTENIEKQKLQVALIKNFGLGKGVAIASSVNHDSHNLSVIGSDDKAMCLAINKVIEHKGGIAIVKDEQIIDLPLNVAGLMSQNDGYLVAKKYHQIENLAKEYGSKLSAPYMTLSFMCLLVIPDIKLSDLGLFDGTSFQFISLFD